MKKKAAALPAKASTRRISQRNINELWEADQEHMPPVDVESDHRWEKVYLLGVTSAIGYVEMAFGIDRAHPQGWPMVDQLRLEAAEGLRRLSTSEATSSTPDRDQFPPTSTVTDLPAVLEHLFQAADNHSEDTGEAHDIGDLQSLLTLAWQLMTTKQRLAFLRSDVVHEHIEAGARDRFTVEDLLAMITPESGGSSDEQETTKRE